MISSNVMLDGILWGGHRWASSTSGTIIPYYFAHASEFGSYDTNWTSIEQNGYRSALQSWANVANLQFVEVSSSANATFIAHSVSSNFFGGGTLGYHLTPDGPAPAHGYFNYQATGWDEDTPNAGLSVGGYGFLTLVHELGHGLGLAHPHDNGGGSSIWPGVASPYNSYGDYGLNQGIFTVMSYNDGWDQVQDPLGVGLTTYGFVGGPSAFDIAAAQFLYGANTSFRSENNIYTVPDSNAPGTYWTAIWDTGGFDQIVYDGSRNVLIDLRAATLDNSPTGGGIPSHANGIFGGFTIANGVVVEAAVGGNGDDVFVGNFSANVLTGRGGADIIYANDGDDSVFGNEGNDFLVGGQGRDFLSGGEGGDVIFGDLGDDYLLGGAGADTFYSVGGIGRDAIGDFQAGNGGDIIHLDGYRSFSEVQAHTFLVDADGVGGSNDAYIIMSSADTIALINVAPNSLLSSNFAFSLTGGQGRDFLAGGDGNDILTGAAGSDYMLGGAGTDTFVLTGQFGADAIGDFQAGLGGDIVRFSSLQNFSDVQSHLHQVDADGDSAIDDAYIIVDASNTVSLLNVAVGSLSSANFVYV